MGLPVTGLGWGEISRLCGISCCSFQRNGILQFWSQEVSGFLTKYSKISVCFIFLRRRFKDRRLIKNDDVLPPCFWLSFSQTFKENSICLCYEPNFLRSVLTRGRDITWELLIGRCLLPSAAQNQLEHVVCEMWKKNENNFLFALFEVKGEKTLRVYLNYHIKQLFFFYYVKIKVEGEKYCEEFTLMSLVKNQNLVWWGRYRHKALCAMDLLNMLKKCWAVLN